MVKGHAASGRPFAICGSRHAMGGQQFLTGAALVDMRRLNRVLAIDVERGTVTAEAGIEWPGLVAHLLRTQRDRVDPWTIATKQTGADKLTLGGAASANAHGRGLTRPPISGDIVELTMVDASGNPIRCSRNENAELFSLAIGGYGLFGPIASMKMKLERRHKVERVVEIIGRKGLIEAFERRIAEGFTLGDWQFATDESSDDLLNRGVFSCYRPAPIDTPIPGGQKKVSMRAWNELVYLAHTDKSRAFQVYADYYLSSGGQIYWSDTSQLGGYDEGYHAVLDRRMRAANPCTEMITEINVPSDRFEEFLGRAACAIREHGASVIYGTVRLIEPDRDTFLPWARRRYFCTIFNLHVEHTPVKIERAAEAFRALVDLAAEMDGSFYLTYHRWATREQIDACHPKFRAFLAKKLEYDPKELFQSDWYRHQKALFAE